MVDALSTRLVWDTEQQVVHETPILMEELQDVVREIDRQQIENTFYRTYYNLFKTLQDTVA